jgi:hypothetical protein
MPHRQLDKALLPAVEPDNSGQVWQVLLAEAPTVAE